MRIVIIAANEDWGLLQVTTELLDIPANKPSAEQDSSAISSRTRPNVF